MIKPNLRDIKHASVTWIGRANARQGSMYTYSVTTAEPGSILYVAIAPDDIRGHVVHLIRKQLYDILVLEQS